MDSMDIIREVTGLGWPRGCYVVFGSGPLAVHGIRETSDIDIFVTTYLYEQLKQQPDWEVQYWDDGGEYVVKDGIFEVDNAWNYGEYNPDPETVIAQADIYAGVPFAPLPEVLRWKQAYGRDKDLRDAKLINAHLQHPGVCALCHQM